MPRRYQYNPDENIRQLLRNDNSTPEQCFRALQRAGKDIWDIRSELYDAGKVSTDPGHFEQLAYKMGYTTLIEARRAVADQLLADHDFGYEVGDVDGWEWVTPGNYISCNVFLEVDPDEPSLLSGFGVEFHPDSAVPMHWG